MATHQLRRFGNLAFLQSIDKPGVLRKLLEPYRDYIEQNGLELERLANDDRCARELLAFFTRTDVQVPEQLLRVTYVLDGLADEDGHHSILEEAEALGIGLGDIPKNSTAGDVAIEVFLKHPELINRCHEKVLSRRVKRYHEYRSRDHRRFQPAEVEEALSRIKAPLGAWFEQRRRTCACEMFAYCDAAEVHVLVTHGGLFQADGSITSELELTRIGWRPQKHASLIYDTRSGILKVNARFLSERRLYREKLGGALTGDPQYFVESPCYTLEPLRQNGGVLALADGVLSARATELVVGTESADCSEIALSGNGLIRCTPGSSPVDIPPGVIVQAVFLIGYAGGGRARRLEVRLPNIADYDRARDGPAAEAFLRANHLLLSPEADADGLVDAA